MLDKLLQAILAGDDEQAERLVGELDRRAMPVLQMMLLDDNPDVRWWGIRALAALGAEPQTIVTVLDDDDSSVRACAALALAHILPSTPESGPEIQAVVEALAAHLADPDPAVGDLCALALARLGAAASPALVEALEAHRRPGGANGTVRIRAVRALSSAATTDAVPALIQALDDDSVTVQHYAEEALARLGVGMVFFKP